MQEFMETKREGLSTQAIGQLMGYDRKTVRKYLLIPETAPGYGPRVMAPSKLDPHKAYLEALLPYGLQHRAAAVGGDGVANQRAHGTTREQVLARWDIDQFSMQLPNGRPPYLYSDDELRKEARDAYMSWQASCYSVPWQYVGKEVWVRAVRSEL